MKTIKARVIEKQGALSRLESTAVIVGKLGFLTVGDEIEIVVPDKKVTISESEFDVITKKIHSEMQLDSQVSIYGLGRLYKNELGF
jgi:hypothetical protein